MLALNILSVKSIVRASMEFGRSRQQVSLKYLSTVSIENILRLPYGRAGAGHVARLGKLLIHVIHDRVIQV